MKLTSQPGDIYFSEIRANQKDGWSCGYRALFLALEAENGKYYNALASDSARYVTYVNRAVAAYNKRRSEKKSQEPKQEEVKRIDVVEDDEEKKEEQPVRKTGAEDSKKCRVVTAEELDEINSSTHSAGTCVKKTDKNRKKKERKKENLRKKLMELENYRSKTVAASSVRDDGDDGKGEADDNKQKSVGKLKPSGQAAPAASSPPKAEGGLAPAGESDAKMEKGEATKVEELDSYAKEPTDLQKVIRYIESTGATVRYVPIRPKNSGYDKSYHGRHLLTYEAERKNSTSIILESVYQGTVQEWESEAYLPSTELVLYYCSDVHYYLSGWKPRYQGHMFINGLLFPPAPCKPTPLPYANGQYSSLPSTNNVKNGF